MSLCPSWHSFPKLALRVRVWGLVENPDNWDSPLPRKGFQRDLVGAG
jgi:hypothetical protein